MDEASINSLKKIEDKEISHLLAGIYRFFNSRFPPENYDLKKIINESGYHMNYLGVEYNINFSYSGPTLNPKGGNIIFQLKAVSQKEVEGLEKIINEARISNTQLDKTKYLADQKIDSNGEAVNAYCRLKKIPEKEDEINELCSQLWTNIIKNVFSAMYRG